MKESQTNLSVKAVVAQICLAISDKMVYSSKKEQASALIIVSVGLGRNLNSLSMGYRDGKDVELCH